MDKQIRERIKLIQQGQIPVGYKKTEFGIFPCNWVTNKRLSDVGSFGKGKGIPGEKLVNYGVPCVGYGDIYPVSALGRIITMVSSVFGIAIVALPAGIITAGYMTELQKSKEADKDIEE